jgi:hypothetical protein
MNEQQRATMYDACMYCAMNCAQRANFYRLSTEDMSVETRRYYIRVNQDDAAQWYAKAVEYRAQQ